jgi:HK97 family phage major capsid protein
MEPEELKNEMEDQFSKFRTLIEQKESEIEENGEVAEETKQALEETRGSIGDIKDRIDEIEKKFQRPEGPNGAGGSEAKTPGQLFAEEFDASELKQNTKVSKQIGSTFETKDLDSTGSGGNLLSRPDRIQDIKQDPLRDTRLRDLMNVSTTQSPSVEYVQETGFANLYTELLNDANSSDTTIDVENANGFYSGQEIEVGSETATVSSKDTTVEPNTITLQSGLSSGKSAGDSVTSDTFEATPEGNLKPRMDIEYEVKDAKVQTIAHGMIASKQILDDMPRLRNAIDTRGMEGLMIAEEDQLLYGDGGSNQLQGILTDPNVQTYNWSSGVSGDEKQDAIRRAMTQATLANYPITGVMLHPSDFEDIELTKDSNGQYIYVNMGSGQSQMVWRVPVIESQALNVGEAVLGAFGLAGEIADRENANVELFEQHKDLAEKNQVYIRVEERVGFLLYRPEAFVKVNFDSAP